MRIEENRSNKWIAKLVAKADINLTHSTARLFSYTEILDLDGGTEKFISKIRDMKSSYGPSYGSLELRESIASIYGEYISWESILVTSGCRNANFLAYYTFLNPEDELLIVTPTWWPIISIPRSFGVRVKFLNTRAEDAFIPDPDALAKLVSKKTKMIVITNPNCPSGSLMDRAALQNIIMIAEKAGIWILCDEIYKGIESDRSTYIPSIAEMSEKGITTSSVSKVFGMPGIRMGWVAGSEAALKEMKIRWNYVARDSGFLDQFVAEIALDNYDRVMVFQRDLAVKNRGILRDWVENEPLIDCPVCPVSGTTAFLKCQNDADSREFALNLVESTGTCVVPGAVYDLEGGFNSFFRIGYMIDSDELEMGLKNISAHLHSI